MTVEKEDEEMVTEPNADVIYSVDKSPMQHRNGYRHHQTNQGTHNGEIKAATFEYLVNCLCRTYVNDEGREECKPSVNKKQFCQIFFETYRTFATPEQLLDKITARIRLVRLDDTSYQSKLIVFKSIEKIIRLWFDKYFLCDFYKPPRHPLIKRYMAGCAHIIKFGAGDGRPVMPEGVKLLQDHLRNLIQVLHTAGLADEHGNFLNEIRRENSFEFIHSEPYEIVTELSKKKGINPHTNQIFLSPSLTSYTIAEQLSKKDAELLLKLVPHECLQAVRMTKAKPKCLRDTIDQFNRVVFTVFGTCVCPSLSTSDRAKVFSKWIEIAECCQQRKNHSSVRAIVSGLRTHAIYRLKKTWQQVSAFHQKLLNMLDHVDATDKSDRNQEINNNTFLKRNSVSSRTLGRLHKRASLAQLPNSGTIPYLGSLLTDLTFLNTAFPDYVERKDMINFEKRRKEYDLILQLQLWQASCKSYQNVETSQVFESWFNHVYLPDEKETQRLSELLEPSTPLLNQISPQKSPRNQTSPRNKFEGKRKSIFFFPTPAKGRQKFNSIQSEDNLISLMQKRSGSCTSPHSPGNDESRMVKVIIYRKTSKSLDGSQAYNYAKVESNTRVMDVIQQTLKSNPDDGNTELYTLVQILPNNREIQFPRSANLYYAMDSSQKEYEFLLLENGATLPKRPIAPSVSSPSLLVPKIHKRSSLSNLRLHISSATKYSIGEEEQPTFLTSKSYSPRGAGRTSPIQFTARRHHFSISRFHGSGDFHDEDSSTIVLKSFAYSDDVFSDESTKENNPCD